MAISRCNKCGALAEHERETVGSSIECARCGTATPIYDAVYFVSKLLDQYFAQRAELQALRHAADTAAPAASPEPPNSPPFDIHNTDHLSSESQHRAIVDWFRARSIAASIDAGAVDTSGYFDEAAVALGNDFALLGEVVERIRYAQQKEFNSALLYLDRKTPEDARALESFARQLQRYSLIARWIKEDKGLRLILQNAPMVRRFFAGSWLEWFALMTGLRVCQDRKLDFSCARNLTLAFPPDEKRELDVFFLLNKTRPLYIECKSGDYRPELDKYVALRKRLGIEAKYFVVCVANLPADQTKALSAMYDLSFTNTETLGPHLATLV